MKQHIPNALTLGNLAAGCLAVTAALQGSPTQAAVWIAMGALMDVADGLAARLLRVSSAIGAELDSLADVVSFGLAPAALLYGVAALHPGTFGRATTLQLAQVAVLLLPLFSALRLARFNVQAAPAAYFEGLPTPANALYVVAIALWLHQGAPAWMYSPIAFWVLCGLQAFLLVSKLPFFSLKGLAKQWWQPVTVALLTATAALGLGWAAAPLGLALYLGLSFLGNAAKPEKQTAR